MEARAQSPWQFIAQHTTALLAVVYLFSAVAGTTYHYFLFAHFDVSVFDYWEAADFLASGVRNPEILLLALLAVLAAVSIIWNEEFDAWAAGRGRVTRMFFGNTWAEKMGINMRNHPIFGLFLGIGFFVFFAWNVADVQRDNIISGKNHRIAVFPGPKGTDVLDAGLVGRTYSFVIAYAHGTGELYAIPLESIDVLQLCRVEGESCAIGANSTEAGAGTPIDQPDKNPPAAGTTPVEGEKVTRPATDTQPVS